MADQTLAIVRAYHHAWTSKDFAQAGRYLASDLETDMPLNDYANAAEFLQALTGFGRLVDSVKLLAEFSRGEEALLLYDMATGPFGTLRVAEHFTVVAEMIVSIRHVHDTVALRAAGLGAPA